MLTERDLFYLRAGRPPVIYEVLRKMTLGYELWPGFVKDNYLDFFIKEGGSKVKILVGKEGSGKSHLLRLIEADAYQLGYETASFSLREDFFKLNDMASFYNMVAERIDWEGFWRQLAYEFAKFMGFEEKYDGQKTVYVLLVEYGFSPREAKREVMKGARDFLKKADLTPSFVNFSYSVLNALAGEEEINQEILTLTERWVKGDNLNRYEMDRIQTFEKLKKINARSWLDSLIKLLVLGGKEGLVVLIDDGEVIVQKNLETNRYYYGPKGANDICEMIRQFIDDGELLQHFLFLLAGRPEMLEDRSRGFKSYEALWMRVQSGLVGIESFNSFADIVEVDKYEDILRQNYGDMEKELGNRLREIFKEAGFTRRVRKGVLKDTSSSLLRQVVMENAALADRE